MPELTKDSEGASGLSRWELALFIGVPVTALCAAGLAYLYLTRNDESKIAVGEESKNPEIGNVEAEESSTDAAPPAEKVS